MSNLNSDFHGDNSVMSIEATNEIRKKLGLKPLEISDSNAADENNSEISSSDRFVHAPASNISHKQSKEKHERKIKNLNEERDLIANLAKEKPLGEDSSESNEDFIRIIKERKEQKLIKENTDTIEEINVSNVHTYRPRDLTGIAVEHRASRFDVYGPTILTLKDKYILDEENDDVLVNVNIIDQEKAEKNIRNKKMGIYGDYKDSSDEDDLLSSLKPPTVLAKYDETIDGERRNRFILDGSGKYTMTAERAEEEMRSHIFKGQKHVLSTENKINSDYYTKEELQQKFKLKKRAARGTRNVTEKIKIETVKKEPSKPKKEEGELAEDEVNKKQSSKRDQSTKKLDIPSSSDEDDYRPAIILPELISDTHVNLELRHILTLMKNAKPKVLHPSNTVSEEDIKTESVAISNGSNTIEANIAPLVFNTTEEYTKSVYDILKSKRKVDADVAAQVKEEPIIKPLPIITKKEEIREEEEPVQSSGWQPEEKLVSLPPQPTKKKRNYREAPILPQPKKKLKLTDGILGDEVQINGGVFSTLLLAKNKGYLDDNKSTQMISNPKNQMLRAQHYQEEKIRYDDIDQKCPRRERRNLPETSFQDKSNFIPDIKLDYQDEFGRPQPAKEAFRALSHRFHGKTSGKIKSEKRYKKLQEQTKITSCIGDTEMKSVSKMQSKMKSENRYCVPLSGKNSIIPAAIRKTEKK